MKDNKPFVFFSYSHEDKDRFVKSFANKLINQGINVWVDYLDMLPGDSLVEKIFDEGIKEADVFILILSKNSIHSRWVREELNIGVINRISRDCKLIPILIDDCEIPEALKSIVWEKIIDLGSYDIELNRIVAAIFGNSLKPEFGSPPKYTQITNRSLPGLTNIDMVVLKVSCEYTLKRGNPFVDLSKIRDLLIDQDISEEQLSESLDILNDKYFIEATSELGGKGIHLFRITTYGFEEYANIFIPDFENIVNNTLITIINENIRDNKSIAQRLNLSQSIIDYIFDILNSRGFIKIFKTFGGGVKVSDITASGKRAARS